MRFSTLDSIQIGNLDNIWASFLALLGLYIQALYFANKEGFVEKWWQDLQEVTSKHANLPKVMVKCRHAVNLLILAAI